MDRNRVSFVKEKGSYNADKKLIITFIYGYNNIYDDQVYISHYYNNQHII